MQQRRFGSTGRNIARLGQGTWNLDGNRADAIAALRAGIDAGMTHIDTAEMYGEAELVIAEAIEGRREGLYIVDKVLPSNASRQGTLKACERSLKRLRTDRIDCYLLHWRGSRPLEETLDAFAQLLEEGKILSWGVSNFDVPDLEEVLEITKSKAPACNQVLYHLKERAIEHAVIPWCAKHGVAVVAYSPFGSGHFPESKALDEVATAHQATPRQVALAFLTREESVFAIPKAGDPRHTQENAGAGDLRLTQADLRKLEKAFPRGPKPRGLPML
jgi:diketogulonate reductase-like aldo/keto reductase